PVGDLAWFGLPPELVAGAGRPVTDPGSGVGRPEYAAVADRVTWWRVALFAVSHPDRWPDKLDRGVAALTQPVQRHLGVQTVDSGAAPFAPDTRWTPVSGPLSVVMRAVPLFVPGLQMVVLALAVAVANRPRFGPAAQGIAAATVFLVIGIWVQFWSVMTFAGTDIARQMLPVTYAHWLLIPLGLVLVLVLFWSRPVERPASG
ncbi:MAG: hypothetical protein L0G99_07755, partial [Propionibacteriales bacterium]|nr:hypothetical protein [Propionibacteriales bacterium]